VAKPAPVLQIAMLLFLPSLYLSAAVQISKTAAADPAWQQTPHQALLADGWHTTPEDASKLETQLAADPENLAIRTRLISYYTQYIIPEPRAKQVLWLIEHHPEADIFSLAPDLTTTARHYADLNSPETIERGRTLWLRQVERFPSNGRVLVNAATALIPHDPMVALDLIRRLRQLEPANPEWVNWLGAIYARAVRASIAGGPEKIRGMTSPSADRNARLAFSLPPISNERLRTELEITADVELVRAAGQALVFETQSLGATNIPGMAAGLEEYKASGAFGERLLQRAKQLPGFR
jgi:hypothetical protein